MECDFSYLESITLPIEVIGAVIGARQRRKSTKQRQIERIVGRGKVTSVHVVGLE